MHFSLPPGEATPGLIEAFSASHFIFACSCQPHAFFSSGCRMRAGIFFRADAFQLQKIIGFPRFHFPVAEGSPAKPRRMPFHAAHCATALYPRNARRIFRLQANTRCRVSITLPPRTDIIIEGLQRCSPGADGSPECATCTSLR